MRSLLKILVIASLTRLDVRNNNIAGDGASKLSAAVLGNAKIEVFNEIPIKEMRADSFTELSLRGKDIGVAGGMVIAGLLPAMASVTSVNVLSNQLDVDSADLLLKVKAEKPNLRTLCGLTHEETELDLNYKFLGPGDAKLLAPEISVMASITSVR